MFGVVNGMRGEEDRQELQSRQGGFVDRFVAPFPTKRDSLTSAIPWEAERELPPWLMCCPCAFFSWRY